MPEIVRSALETGPLPAAPYVFAVTTSGEKTGNALSAVDSVMRRSNRRLPYGVNVPLADNSIILRTPQASMEDRLGRLDEVADGIAHAVRNRARNDVRGQRSASLAAMGRVNELGFMRLYKAKRRIVERERCSHCGLCSKLCPVGNISMRQGEVDIGRECRWCFACLNWCPQQAIKFGRIDPSVKGQYRCPGMAAGDIRQAREQRSEIAEREARPRHPGGGAAESGRGPTTGRGVRSAALRQGRVSSCRVAPGFRATENSRSAPATAAKVCAP